ncbi:hypothetical protein [Brevundimonas sp. SL130]|uniref:hypothetical protein n=1 Tax=Brevundimonas sp. SL130 TaxID=2995143 RepID=UPI00226C75C1|nr:hypothetical protein [Brevundimonas sp. SL130]WAC59763.1 hypothetical protein OU998_16385 [Brevundimonas sp. SL130]
MMRPVFGVLAGLIFSGLGFTAQAQAQAQGQTQARPAVAVVVKVQADADSVLPVRVTYEDGTGRQEFKKIGRDSFNISLSSQALSSGGQIVIHDADAVDDYDDRIQLDGQAAHPGQSLSIIVDRRIAPKCNRTAIRSLTDGDPSPGRTLARYLVIRQVRYRGLCVVEAFKREVVETWYRLSLRINRDAPIFALDRRAEKEMRRLDPYRLKQIQQEET